MAVPLRPSSQLVVEEWVRTIPDLADNGVAVAAQLPTDINSWATSGFVVVNILLGTRDMYLSMGRPIAQIEAFAVKPSTGKPLWNTAKNIIMAVIAAMEDESTIRRTLTISPGGRDYGQARVLSCYTIHEGGEPRRLYHPLVDNPTLNRTKDDPAQYARVVLDTEFHWCVA